MSLTEILRRTIQIHNLFPSNTLLVAAVSGGTDSLALLHALYTMRHTLAISLHVATLDHGLRGIDGQRDVQFVVQTAAEWGLPATAETVNVSQIAQAARLGIEAAARQARYDFLARTARKVGAFHIVTAHHAGDQAETILMHLLRGSGLYGLRGMAFRAPLPSAPDLILVRPLLLVSRLELEAYCQTHGLTPRQDMTNQDVRYQRNYIRLQTLPHLARLNPQIERVLGQLADVVAAEQDFAETQFMHIVYPHIQQDSHRVWIDRQGFAQLHLALQRRFIYWAVGQLTGTVHELGFTHISSALDVALRGKVGALALLPAGLRLRADYTTVFVEQSAAPLPNHDVFLLETAHEIVLSDQTVTGTWRLSISETPPPVYQLRLQVPEEARLSLRTRRAGDVFRPLGLAGHRQKIKKWMIDRKIPQHLRDFIPLLLVNGEIAAVLSGNLWTLAEPFAVREDSQGKTLYLYVENIPKSG